MYMAYFIIEVEDKPTIINFGDIKIV